MQVWFHRGWDDSPPYPEAKRGGRIIYRYHHLGRPPIVEPVQAPSGWFEKGWNHRRVTNIVYNDHWYLQRCEIEPDWYLEAPFHDIFKPLTEGHYHIIQYDRGDDIIPPHFFYRDWED